MPSGSSAVLDRPLQRQHARARARGACPARLSSPTPCSPVTVPPSSIAAVDDVVERRLRARARAASSPCWVSSSGCRLPSPAWATVAIADVVRDADLLDAGQHLASRPRGRQTSSVRMAVAALLERRVGETPGVEQRLRLHRIGRHDRIARAGGSNSARIASASAPPAGSGRSVRAEEERRCVVREAGSLPFVHGLQAMAVDELELRGLQAAGRDPGDRGAACGEGVEEPDDGPRRGGPGRSQPDRDLGDHAEGALGPTMSPTRS